MRKNETIALAAMPGMLRFADENAGATGTGEYIAHAEGGDGSIDSKPIEASSADEARGIGQEGLDEGKALGLIADDENVVSVREATTAEVAEAALGNDDDIGLNSCD